MRTCVCACVCAGFGTCASQSNELMCQTLLNTITWGETVGECVFLTHSAAFLTPRSKCALHSSHSCALMVKCKTHRNGQSRLILKCSTGMQLRIWPVNRNMGLLTWRVCSHPLSSHNRRVTSGTHYLSPHPIFTVPHLLMIVCTLGWESLGAKCSM